MFPHKKLIEPEFFQQQRLFGVFGEIGVHRAARRVQRHHEHSKAHSGLQSQVFFLSPPLRNYRSFRQFLFIGRIGPAENYTPDHMNEDRDA